LKCMCVAVMYISEREQKKWKKALLFLFDNYSSILMLEYFLTSPILFFWCYLDVSKVCFLFSFKIQKE
uniref:Uncharacterized protein n=1 Tax=Aegilops tauschii subsp. strangulata TaxID=200361 RepID=A0A453NAZ5_AEGTS